MDTSRQQARVELVKSVDAPFISQLNGLLDEGMTWDAQKGEAFLADPGSALLVAYVDDKAVGFLTANRLQRFDKRGAEVLLYEIGVHEDYRRMGIGTALIEAVRRWAKSVGADEVWVLTNKSNTAAVSLYLSAGASTAGPTPDEILFDFDV